VTFGEIAEFIMYNNQANTKQHLPAVIGLRVNIRSRSNIRPNKALRPNVPPPLRDGSTATEIAAMSTRGKRLTVDSAGHYIQMDQPQVVIDSILEIVRTTHGQ
jgi:hypothetical protein